MRFQVLLSVVLAVLLQGCASEKSAGTVSDDVVVTGLKKSPTYQALAKRVKRAGFMVDQETDEVLIVDVGENMAERFARSDTLKISKKDGTIWKQKIDSSGEEVWELEVSPK